MHAGKTIIVISVVAVVSLSVLGYSLFSNASFAPVSNQPATATPAATNEPASTMYPESSPTATPVTTAGMLRQIPIPSAPEFTMKYVESYYDVPAKYKIDEFSGQQVLISTAKRYMNQSIEITIKNQPFTPFQVDGKQFDLYYNVSWKGHYGDDWRYSSYNDKASDSSYTVIPIYPIHETVYYTDHDSIWLTGVPPGDYDFQVQAFIGYYTKTGCDTPLGIMYHVDWTGQTSAWSNTQTLSIR